MLLPLLKHSQLFAEIDDGLLCGISLLLLVVATAEPAEREHVDGLLLEEVSRMWLLVDDDVGVCCDGVV